MRHFVGIERFLGTAPIGDPTKLARGGVRKEPILRLRESSRFSSLATASGFAVADKWLS